jgi:dihydroflavonol-4-reductase
MAGVSRMVHVSSCCVFSGGSREHPSTELSEFTGFRFNSGYINSKYLAQHWVLSEVERKGFPVVIVNPTILIGPYDLRPTSGETVLRILRQQIQLCPTGVKNFIDVRDAASAICNALTAGTPGECYLLGSENLSFFELFGKVNRISGRPGVRISVPGTILRGAGLIGNAIRSLTGNEVPLNFCHSRQLALESCFCSEKAVRVLGLRQNPIDNAIRDAIGWFYDNGYLDEVLIEFPVLQHAA